MIYKAFWLLLQTCYTILDILKRFCCRSQFTIRSYDQRRNNNKNKDEHFLKTCITQLNKLPSHLSIIIGPEELGIENQHILQIINYALWMKIDFISLYDARSDKRYCNLLNMELPKHVRVKQLGEIHLLCTKDQFRSENTCHVNGNANGYKNGTKSDSFFRVLEVKPFQGHALIGDVCSDFFKQRSSYEAKEVSQQRTLLTSLLDEELTMRLWKFKDPELCIIFSKHMCTFGMLPWQMRFTEFYLHKYGNMFDARTFAKILFQYARCEQRWGK